MSLLLRVLLCPADMSVVDTLWLTCECLIPSIPVHLQVLVLERTAEAGRKVLMSGGTRCNVLPYSVDMESDFFTDSSRSAMRAIFSSWELQQCKQW